MAATTFTAYVEAYVDEERNLLSDVVGEGKKLGMALERHVCWERSWSVRLEEAIWENDSCTGYQTSEVVCRGVGGV